MDTNEDEPLSIFDQIEAASYNQEAAGYKRDKKVGATAGNKFAGALKDAQERGIRPEEIDIAAITGKLRAAREFGTETDIAENENLLAQRMQANDNVDLDEW